MTLKEQLSTYEVVPVCFFMSKLVHVESMFDIEFMKEMAKTKVVKLILSSSSDGILISVLRCCSVMDRFRWITSLIGGEDVTPRRTVVIANAPERVHYLAYLLTFYGVNNVHITRDDNLLAVENAVRLWRMEECCVFIADYDSLDDLDYGYVETCILYELPDYFPSYERRLLDLSAKLSYGRSLHIMMNVELDRAQAGSVLKFLTDHNQVVPDYLVNMLDRHDGSSSAESKISQER
ncbi:hypothetical protein KIN20_030991 [Parelaphostrongylus tenuis]|uniref:Uncharacterized protein n=1 Tax=Parelaphostrongylus tenuis TaxID=148309 RepID=A0AAD5R4Z8_PARTN|nr:hypothetical protein KIN20_030991 [Parelaphostrongylus tenuis]